MDMKEEMMNDALDDALGDEDDEEERYGNNERELHSSSSAHNYFTHYHRWIQHLVYRVFYRVISTQ